MDEKADSNSFRDAPKFASIPPSYATSTGSGAVSDNSLPVPHPYFHQPTPNYVAHAANPNINPSFTPAYSSYSSEPGTLIVPTDKKSVTSKRRLYWILGGISALTIIAVIIVIAVVLTNKPAASNLISQSPVPSTTRPSTTLVTSNFVINARQPGSSVPVQFNLESLVRSSGFYKVIAPTLGTPYAYYLNFLRAVDLAALNRDAGFTTRCTASSIICQLDLTWNTTVYSWTLTSTAETYQPALIDNAKPNLGLRLTYSPFIDKTANSCTSEGRTTMLVFNCLLIKTPVITVNATGCAYQITIDSEAGCPI